MVRLWTFETGGNRHTAANCLRSSVTSRSVLIVVSNVTLDIRLLFLRLIAFQPRSWVEGSMSMFTSALELEDVLRDAYCCAAAPVLIRSVISENENTMHTFLLIFHKNDMFRLVAFSL
jgi:hypothetical protein